MSQDKHNSIAIVVMTMMTSPCECRRRLCCCRVSMFSVSWQNRLILVDAKDARLVHEGQLTEHRDDGEDAVDKQQRRVPLGLH